MSERLPDELFDPVRRTSLDKFLGNWSYNLRFRTGEAIQYSVFGVMSLINGTATLEQGFNTGKVALENGSVFGALHGISGTIFYAATALGSFYFAREARKILTHELPN